MHKGEKRKINPLFLVGERKKRKHDDEVESFIERYKSEFDNNILESYKIDPKIFWQNFTALCQRWVGIYVSIGDCTGKRLAYETLRATQNNLIATAIMGDSLEAFKQAIKDQQIQNLQPTTMYWVEAACLCGAKSITDYIIENKILNIADSENAISYAVSSGNKELALRVAAVSKEQGKEDPGPVSLYAFGNIYLTKEINSMFSSQNLIMKI